MFDAKTTSPTYRLIRIEHAIPDVSLAGSSQTFRTECTTEYDSRENNGRLNSDNACYHSLLSLLSFQQKLKYTSSLLHERKQGLCFKTCSLKDQGSLDHSIFSWIIKI
jgi:hypothetical protein